MQDERAYMMAPTVEVPADYAENLTFDRLNSLAYLAGLAYGTGADTRDQAGHVASTIVRDARAESLPVAAFILSFAEGYAAGMDSAND